jgi:hypothetical protein
VKRRWVFCFSDLKHLQMEKERQKNFPLNLQVIPRDLGKPGSQRLWMTIINGGQLIFI